MIGVSSIQRRWLEIEMLEGKDPVLQAFLGTLLTWGLTAAGAAMAFFISGHQVSNILSLSMIDFVFN